MIGVYWGAFDPLTVAHQAIIVTALREIPLKKIIIIVNNHNYKKYSEFLAVRLARIKQALEKVENIEVRWQDEIQKMDYSTLRQMIEGPICAIAGYDAYRAWGDHSTAQARGLYDAIAVVPRGDDIPYLVDTNAFLLPIEDKYKYISSTKIREQAYAS